MLFRETVAVYCENHTEHTNTLCGQTKQILLLKWALYILATEVSWIIYTATLNYITSHKLMM
jgi:hypothetical protein